MVTGLPFYYCSQHVSYAFFRSENFHLYTGAKKGRENLMSSLPHPPVGTALHLHKYEHSALITQILTLYSPRLLRVFIKF